MTEEKKIFITPMRHEYNVSIHERNINIEEEEEHALDILIFTT